MHLASVSNRRTSWTNEDLYKRALGIYEQAVGYDRDAYVKTLRIMPRSEAEAAIREAERLEERAKSVLKRLSLESQSQGKQLQRLPCPSRAGSVVPLCGRSGP